jgi:sirohydrochlorin cobaltochelatase
MKKALLAVSFGTSVPGADAAIISVENALKEACPDRDLFRAYTSRIICRKLRDEGRPILTPEEALELIAAEGYTDVIVQPTHLTPGKEYEKLCSISAGFEDRFVSLRVASPLISSPEDLKDVAEAVLAHFPPQDGRALVLMGHGTGHIANMIYPALQTAFRLAGAEEVYVGTVEGWPGIDDVVRQLKKSGCREIDLAPFMLVAGDHAVNDMAGYDPDSWKSILSGEGFTVRCVLEGIGSWDEIHSIYSGHLLEV